ncbi:MAG: hypothetical protein KGH61_00645 [Candidatus Micrarchaeota archaeon]|nr:hypothetical protein [Candidatus Micrarchaeota archaeon]MDE1847444.1 hypothetical protein [Candidatus Micrarchaeota archaeon]MDE1864061.1 hypothetical protein [Candidatus Micrarchaeota archaeon]
MGLKAFRSPDGRYRTALYSVEGEEHFLIAEKTANGVLLSEFTGIGEVVDQVYKASANLLAELKAYPHGAGEITISERPYEYLTVNVHCTNCDSRTMRRELDSLEVSKIVEVPVVPMFLCTKCNKKFYTMSKRYLRNLIARNPELFEKEELKRREENEAAFLSEIQEYMVRIFASKRLALIKIDG